MIKPFPWDRITVVLVTRNSEKIIPSSLGSLTKAQRVILIDAMSTDDTISVAQKNYPKLEVISLTEDKGLGAATNKGFALANTEYVLNINPDTKFTDSCIEQLVLAADANPNTAGIAPILTNARGNIDLSVMGPWEHNHQKLGSTPDGPFCTWFLTGAIVLWRLSAFRTIGGFDENIFLYNEDTDLSIRSMQNGYPLIVDPSANALHFGGLSEELSLISRIRRDKNMMWGYLNFEKKYAGTKEANLIAKETFKNCCGETILGLITFRFRKFITNAVKAKAAYSFLVGGVPWGRN
tara:strand:+ start:516 stop:1397 length:882 start_codon:yes stop_codon:yes gene_type:complete